MAYLEMDTEFKSYLRQHTFLQNKAYKVLKNNDSLDAGDYAISDEFNNYRVDENGNWVPIEDSRFEEGRKSFRKDLDMLAEISDFLHNSVVMIKHRSLDKMSFDYLINFKNKIISEFHRADGFIREYTKLSDEAKDPPDYSKSILYKNLALKAINQKIDIKRMYET